MNALLLLAVIVVLSLPVVAAPPVVSNVRAAQLAGTKNIEVLYDVSDADGNLLTIAVQVSGDAGQTYTIPATALSGHIGVGVASGANRRIIWNAGADWNGQLVSNGKVRVTASDGTTPAPPPGMVYIPAGVFQMGDNFNEIGPETLPVHNVYVSGFFMDRFEVTKEVWLDVWTWAQSNGYAINAVSYDGNGFPAQRPTWFDAVKWCNARSEKEGFTAVYYTNSAQTTVYRTGDVVVDNTMAMWGANGYRLPTEAEWEKAARGGTLGSRYSWGNNVNTSQANYVSSGDPFDRGGSLTSATTPAGYYNGTQIPTGVDMANGYGLYDMAGNVEEWCWDWYGSSYYGTPAAVNDPHGPATGSLRIARGGSWALTTTALRCAQRTNTSGVSPREFDIGLRAVRKAP